MWTVRQGCEGTEITTTHPCDFWKKSMDDSAPQRGFKVSLSLCGDQAESHSEAVANPLVAPSTMALPGHASIAIAASGYQRLAPTASSSDAFRPKAQSLPASLLFLLLCSPDLSNILACPASTVILSYH